MKLNRLAADVNPDNPWRDAGEDFPGDGACFSGDLIDTDVRAAPPVWEPHAAVWCRRRCGITDA